MMEGYPPMLTVMAPSFGSMGNQLFRLDGKPAHAPEDIGLRVSPGTL